MEYSKNYDVKEDIIFKSFKNEKRGLSENTIRGYITSLNIFCEANKETLKKIYDTCKSEQVDKIENNIIIKFSPNDINSSIKRYFNNFIDHMENKNKNKNSTINSRVKDVRAFFKKMEINTPNWEKLNEEKPKWTLLTKDDINFVMNDSTLTYKSIITFLLSTGMRESDACSLTIGDFMEATKEYHNFVNVEDFIDNAPEDMISYWNFDPQKTRKFSVHCKTFNSPESSNYILQNLKRIKNEYIPRVNKEKKLNLKISKNSYLFGSRKENFLGKIEPQYITDTFTRKNKKLRAYNINKIDQKIANGKLSEEDRDKEIEKIPNFHAHGLRKYFITTVNKYGDLRRCLLLEGHNQEIQTDESYIKLKKDDVKEVYLKSLHELTLEPIEARIITDSQAEKFKQQINAVNKQLNEKEKVIEQSKEQIEDLKDKLNKKDEEIEKKLREKDKEFEEKLKEKDKEMENRYKDIQNQMDELKNQINNNTYTYTNPILREKPLMDEFDAMVYPVIWKYIHSCRDKEDDNLSRIEEKIKKLDDKEILKLMDVANSITLNKKIHYTEGGLTNQVIESIIKESIIRMSTDPVLKEEFELQELNQNKFDKFVAILEDKLDEIGLWGERTTPEQKIIIKDENGNEIEKTMNMLKPATERDDITEDIITSFGFDIEQTPIEEINEELVSKYIEKILLK